MVALRGHDEVTVCPGCIGWLRQQAGVPDSTPILPVADLAQAASFHESAGFDVRLWEDGGYAFATLDDESVFDLGLTEGLDPATNAASCYLIIADADVWHARLVDGGLPVGTIEDQPYGMREFTLVDPSGNRIRIGHRL